MRFGLRCDDNILGMCDYVQSTGMVLQKEVVELGLGLDKETRQQNK